MQKIAFFDLDNTIIINTNSLMLYVKYLIRKKQLSYLSLLKGGFYSALHKFNLVNIEKLLDAFVLPYKNRSDQDMWDLTNDWFDKDVKHLLSQEAYDKIQWHKKQNHKTVLLSSASQYVCVPVKNYFKLDDSIHSIVEVQNGILTGKFLKPLCYQDGKILYAKKFCEENHIDMKDSYFYTDSITDLPMLNMVANPIIINPDPLLKRHAKKQNWQIESWQTPFSQSQP